MKNAAQYFKLARSEETAGNESAALLLYLSSFCESFNADTKSRPVGAVAKIRRLQMRLLLSDYQLLALVHSYGPLTDRECQQLLYFSIHGNVSGINTILAGYACGN